MDKLAKWILILIILLIAFILWLGFYSTKNCYDSGGEMVGTGQYTTTYIQSGNVMIPFQNEVLECSK